MKYYAVLESIQWIRKRPTYRFEDNIFWARWYFWRSEINIDYRLIQCIRGFCSSPLPTFKLSLRVPWIDSSQNLPALSFLTCFEGVQSAYGIEMFSQHYPYRYFISIFHNKALQFHGIHIHSKSFVPFNLPQFVFIASPMRAPFVLPVDYFIITGIKYARNKL